MSDLTKTNLMRAALMTRLEATVINPREVDPWVYQFEIRLRAHLDSELAHRLASLPCFVVMPDKKKCPGPDSDFDEPVCDRCNGKRFVKREEEGERALKLDRT